MAHLFYRISFAVLGLAGLITYVWPPFVWVLGVLLFVFVLGVLDSLQVRRAVKRNFPIAGKFRYLFEAIRPEINQYFVESNTDGMPFSREQRSVVYQRAKRQLSTLPFGTQRDLYAVGAEWLNHSLHAVHPHGDAPRVRVGGPKCTQPYDSALLNISAMSFGALSKRAIEALNRGALMGGFSHNTGEGSISSYHDAGGDLVWQVGTGYFGCRTATGGFDRDKFAKNARRENVKMIELKLSQGAKPGHGGLLPAAKITPEIAEIRGVPLNEDVNSPPSHSAFDGPRGLIRFLDELRELSGGKPVGFKLCVGHRAEFLSIVRAMHELDSTPDFITVDGAEGGTGAAPLEFSNSVGWPLTEGLVFVQNALVGYGVRDRIKVIAAGKIVTAFDMAKRMALGADLCNSARGMMFALGCIQARKCHANDCPVGVATQNPRLVRGLVVSDKIPRVAHYQIDTVKAFVELLGAAGIVDPTELAPRHILRRTSTNEIKSYAEVYEFLEPGSLLDGSAPSDWQVMLGKTDVERFASFAQHK